MLPHAARLACADTIYRRSDTPEHPRTTCVPPWTVNGKGARMCVQTATGNTQRGLPRAANHHHTIEEVSHNRAGRLFTVGNPDTDFSALAQF